MPTRLIVPADAARILVVMQNNRIASQCVNPAVWDADLVQRYFYGPQTRAIAYTNTGGTILAVITGSIWHTANEDDGVHRYVSLNRIGIHTTVTNAQVNARIDDMMKAVLIELQNVNATNVRFPWLPGSVLTYLRSKLLTDNQEEAVTGGAVLNGLISAWKARWP